MPVKLNFLAFIEIIMFKLWLVLGVLGANFPEEKKDQKKLELEGFLRQDDDCDGVRYLYNNKGDNFELIITYKGSMVVNAKIDSTFVYAQGEIFNLNNRVVCPNPRLCANKLLDEIGQSC